MLDAAHFLRAHGVSSFVFYTAKGAVADLVSEIAPQLLCAPRTVHLRAPAPQAHPHNNNTPSSEPPSEPTLDDFQYLSRQIIAAPHAAPQPAQPLDPRAAISTEAGESFLDVIGIATWALSHLIGLPHAAPVFITADGKDPRRIAAALGLPEDAPVFLFDDQGLYYASQLSMATPSTPSALRAARRIIPVKMYEYANMPPATRDMLVVELGRCIGPAATAALRDRGVGPFAPDCGTQPPPPPWNLSALLAACSEAPT